MRPRFTTPPGWLTCPASCSQATASSDILGHFDPTGCGSGRRTAKKAYVPPEIKAALLSDLKYTNSVAMQLFVMMQADGFGIGRGDASMRKYPRYIALLSDHGEFNPAKSS